jgi:iron complex transport system ATP-binding protein
MNPIRSSAADRTRLATAASRSADPAAPQAVLRATESRGAALLETRALALRAGATPHGRVLFDDLTISVHPHECWVVLGPNGAGKSSLLAALAGVFVPAHGSVAVDGRPLAEWPPVALADRRAWCPQFWSDPFPASVLDTVQLARHRRAGWKASFDEPDARVSAVVERLELAGLLDADVRTLSGGERQRVAIATTLLQETPLLLLDEPASHLDLGHQHLLLEVLRDHAGAGGAVVASLHDLNLAWDLASHVVLLDGRGSASAGTRDALMTPARLGGAFGVGIEQIAVGARQRFWSVPNPMAPDAR